MEKVSNYQHWTLKKDDQGILWLGIDRHDSSVNTLNQHVLREFDSVLDEIEQDNSINAVILYSAKKTGFVAGADITQFLEIKTMEEAFNLIRQGQLVFTKLAAMQARKPTVAMIEGFCLGGGLELALACKYRVAENSRKTKLGLPEVLLGLIPGWGGTVRLPLLIGAANAMKLILAGKIVSAEEAVKLGFVDVAVPERVLKNAALHYAKNQPTAHQPTQLQRLSHLSFVRPFLAKIFYRQLIKKIRPEHYPAPFAVIKNWEEYGPEHSEAMLQEAKTIGELMIHPTGRNLLRVFFLKERLKGLAKGLEFAPKHVHVIGSGTMGSAIAAVCALAGFTVTLQDKAPELIAPAIKKAHDIFKYKLKSSREVSLVMDRLIADDKGLGLQKADVVVEAIIENLEAKHELYQRIENQLKPGALLATNTSSLPLQDLAKGLAHPENLVGLHFFNPVDRMELVEVVSDSNTATDKVNQGLAFVKKLGRLPLPVLSKPGFLVNRILMPYLLESITLLEEGVPAFAIDKAAKDFGMPMGPIELSDKVGLDICLSVAEILTQHYQGTVPAQLREMVSQGKLGQKSGGGFYRYQNGKIVSKPRDEKTPLLYPQEDIIDRLILRMLNEAVACLREGIVSDDDLLDAGMIFGTGFAPFRGGPIHYAKKRGILEISQRLEKLATQYGDRFKPDAGWQSLEEERTSDANTAVSPSFDKTHHETAIH